MKVIFPIPLMIPPPAVDDAAGEYAAKLENFHERLAHIGTALSEYLSGCEAKS